jgi:membrane protein YdbS with pleckstrin-like domain
MKELHIEPDRGQRTAWLIHWALWFFPVLIALLILMLIQPLAFGLCALGWALFMLPLGLWLTAYFRSLGYTIADDIVKGQRGVFFKRYVTVPYHKITNVDVTQGPLQRKFGVGFVHCQTAGAGGQQGARAELKMEGIKDLEGLKDAIMERIRNAATAGAERPTATVTAQEDPETLRQMLVELKAIRQALENRER